ncbi:uncharacterized protein LOC141594092 isoform X2 [Silene latifolia]|uniref:uncharacterized protein LOC141594092 isoform X2 n=1 Tax=Silene latifolia TaxID=37657 RepID=UPI003D76ADF7
MLDSSTKPPENRIHLFDPVGLINDGYGGTYRSSNYAVKPRRPTKSYGNFEEVATNGGLKSYDSFNTDENGVGALRSYDSYTDPNVPGLRSYDSFSMETNNNGGNNTRSYDHNNNNDDTNGLELRFGVHDNNNNGEMDEDYDVSTPRLWKPSSPTSPNKSLNSSSYFQNNNSFNSTNSTNNSGNSSPFHPRNSKSLNSSPLHPSILKPTNSNNNNNNNNNNNSSVIAVNSMSLNPSSPRHNYPQNLSPSSRTQAIAKGRRELMDMVRDLPESFYELSLKDIVDKKTEYGVQKGVGIGIDISEEKKGGKDNGIKPMETNKTMKKKSKKVKKSESKKKMVVVRGKNVDRGRFLLRTSVFPIFSRSKKNKKRLVNGNSFKVAPMSKPNPSSNGSMKVVEKDWWGRKSTIESDDGNGVSNKSESSESSSISSRSSSSNGRYFLKWLRCFIHMTKN